PGLVQHTVVDNASKLPGMVFRPKRASRLHRWSIHAFPHGGSRPLPEPWDVVCDPSGPWWEVLWNWRWLSSDNLRLVVQGRPVDSKGPAYRRRRQPVADLSSCCGPKKKPRRSGALSLRVPRGSEAVARGDAEQVGVAVEHAHQVRTAGRLGVDVRRVDLDPHVGRVDAQLRRHVPGRAQGVDHALLVGQARGAGRVVGRALVVADAEAEGERLAEVELAADRVEDRVFPLERL